MSDRATLEILIEDGGGGAGTPARPSTPDRPVPPPETPPAPKPVQSPSVYGLVDEPRPTDTRPAAQPQQVTTRPQPQRAEQEEHEDTSRPVVEALRRGFEVMDRSLKLVAARLEEVRTRLPRADTHAAQGGKPSAATTPAPQPQPGTVSLTDLRGIAQALGLESRGTQDALEARIRKAGGGGLIEAARPAASQQPAPAPATPPAQQPQQPAAPAPDVYGLLPDHWTPQRPDVYGLADGGKAPPSPAPQQLADMQQAGQAESDIFLTDKDIVGQNKNAMLPAYELTYKDLAPGKDNLKPKSKEDREAETASLLKQQAGRDTGQMAGQAFGLGNTGALAGHALSGGAMMSMPGVGMIVAAAEEAKQKVLQGIDVVGDGVATIAKLDARGAAEGMNQFVAAVVPGGEFMAKFNDQLFKVSDALDQTAKRFAPYSAQISVAGARAEAANVQGELRRARQLEGELSRFVDARSRLEQAGQDALVRILKPILPIVVAHLEQIAAAVEFLAGSVREEDKGDFVEQMFKALEGMAEAAPQRPGGGA